MCQNSNRTTIALVGTIPNLSTFTSYFKFLSTYILNVDLSTMNFSSPSDLTDYTASPNWGSSPNYPAICFGIAFQQIDINSYNYSLFYLDAFDDNIAGIKDIPNQARPSLNPFQMVLILSVTING